MVAAQHRGQAFLLGVKDAAGSVRPRCLRWTILQIAPWVAVEGSTRPQLASRVPQPLIAAISTNHPPSKSGKRRRNSATSPRWLHPVPTRAGARSLRPRNLGLPACKLRTAPRAGGDPDAEHPRPRGGRAWRGPRAALHVTAASHRAPLPRPQCLGFIRRDVGGVARRECHAGARAAARRPVGGADRASAQTAGRRVTGAGVVTGNPPGLKGGWEGLGERR